MCGRPDRLGALLSSGIQYFPDESAKVRLDEPVVGAEVRSQGRKDIVRLSAGFWNRPHPRPRYSQPVIGSDVPAGGAGQRKVSGSGVVAI